MATIQYQKGSYTAAIPPEVIEQLQAKKGDKIYFNITENGEVKVIKIKEETK